MWPANVTLLHILEKKWRTDLGDFFRSLRMYIIDFGHTLAHWPCALPISVLGCVFVLRRSGGSGVFDLEYECGDYSFVVHFVLDA
jgi:hypothetical protein